MALRIVKDSFHKKDTTFLNISQMMNYRQNKKKEHYNRFFSHQYKTDHFKMFFDLQSNAIQKRPSIRSLRLPDIIRKCDVSEWHLIAFYGSSLIEGPSCEPII